MQLPPRNLWSQEQYTVVKPEKSYPGGVFWMVGVVDLVILACVLRVTTTKRWSTFGFAPPPIFFLELPLIGFPQFGSEVKRLLPT